jgi:raffinose/stachyose/melibiose transport system permease protein
VRLPLARPALSTITVLQTIKAWNEFFLPRLVFTDDSGWSLPLGMQC